MRYRVYIRVEGRTFDPESFNRGLPNKLQGQVRMRECMRVRSDGPERVYWQSMPVDVEDRPEEALTAILRDFVGSLKKIADAGIGKISAQIVNALTEQDDVRGLYVSPDLIQMLAVLHADLDLDVVHDLQRGSPSVSQ